MKKHQNLSRGTGKCLRCEDLEELPSGKPCPDCVPHNGTERTEDLLKQAPPGVLLKHKATKRTKVAERMERPVRRALRLWLMDRWQAPARFEGMPCSEWLERLPGEPPAI